MPDLTPEEIAAASNLARTKELTRATIVSHMNGVGAAIIAQYPDLEVKSWPIQQPEAAYLIRLGEATVLALGGAGARESAPYLMDVCDGHFGPTSDIPGRMVQLWQKAQVVAALAATFLSVAAFLNGLRARMDDRLTAATSVPEVYIIESETQTELSGFRDAYGV